MHHLSHAARIVHQGLRAAMFTKIDPTDREGSFSQLIALIAASFIFKFVIDFAGIGLQGEFAFFGLPGALLEVPLLLAAAWSLALLGRQPEAGLRLAVRFSAISLVVSVLGEGLLGALDSRLIGDRLDAAGLFYPLNTHLLPAWLALAAAIAGIRLLELPAPRIGPALVISALLIWLPLAQVGPYHTLWTYPYDEEAMGGEHEARDALTGERTFYAQTALLDRTLASLRPSQSDRINLYFVGVAGDSSQDVFMKEVRYVGNFFKAHFGTSGRSIALINNANSVEDAPAASVTSLRQALNRIGEVMDPEKDILFLYLTSHGSREHRLTLDFGSIRFDELNPTVLRKLLDDSGIKHRVVVVSACYSGGFVKPLEDPDTLVITAAAPDKTS
ncbi:MAG: C13 family peptidase [Propionivibrio sp.]